MDNLCGGCVGSRLIWTSMPEMCLVPPDPMRCAWFCIRLVVFKQGCCAGCAQCFPKHVRKPGTCFFPSVVAFARAREARSQTAPPDAAGWQPVPVELLGRRKETGGGFFTHSGRKRPASICRSGVPLCDSAHPLFDPLCLAALNTGIPRGSAPCNSDAH
eukprot:349913-Chlamydomonas_euryale.AAC.3